MRLPIGSAKLTSEQLLGDITDLILFHIPASRQTFPIAHRISFLLQKTNPYGSRTILLTIVCHISAISSMMMNNKSCQHRDYDARSEPGTPRGRDD